MKGISNRCNAQAIRERVIAAAHGVGIRYIAAIAASHDFVVASRDASAFKAAGLAVIDPWTGGA